MGFFSLRVLNEDRVAPAKGFATHSHRDMEIVSYVLSGALQHKDSMGNGSVIRPGDVQRMSAGTGVMHSEFNASTTELVHFLQIWVIPDKKGYAPGYEQKFFSPEDKRGRFQLIASKDGREGSVTIHQDAAIYAGLFDGGEQAVFELNPGRAVWVHVAQGQVELNGTSLQAGDAAAVGGGTLEFKGGQQAEVLLFELAST
jgi:redox-sensitive bicupin YhaK (pirin superfamily)